MLLFEYVSLIQWIARARRPFMASLLMASLVTTMLGPLVHADDGHDTDFSAAIVHDASQHRLTAGSGQASTSAAEQHCVACHVVRLVREGPAVALVVQPFLLSADVSYHGTDHVLPRISGPPLPARAPPASSIA